MNKKYLLAVAVVGALALALAACATDRADVTETQSYDDGTYRGVFYDGGIMQVNIQFRLEDDVISSPRFRHLFHRDIDYRAETEDGWIAGIKEQHNAILEYLDGRHISAMYDLYDTGAMLGTEYDVDGATAATVRGNKLFSAMQDALNRGAYSPAGELTRVLPTVQDGRYRGTFGDGGNMQVNVQFDVRDGVITGASYRYLWYSDVDFRAATDDAWVAGIKAQHDALLDYLVGNPVGAIFDLYTPGEVLGTEHDVDGATGATVRGNKIHSAFRDGINRGIYSPANGAERILPVHADGRYRGEFGDGGYQQVGVQFTIEDGVFGGGTYRHLFYRGTNYRGETDDVWAAGIRDQYSALFEYLEGRPVTALYDLHNPGEALGTEYDVDGATGATLRANKAFSAIMDGLNRGVY